MGSHTSQTLIFTFVWHEKSYKRGQRLAPFISSLKKHHVLSCLQSWVSLTDFRQVPIVSMIFSSKDCYYFLEYEAFCGFQITFGMTATWGGNTTGAHQRKTHQLGYTEAVIFCTEHIETEPSVNTWHCRDRSSIYASPEGFSSCWTL